MVTPGPEAPAMEPHCLLCWTLLLLFVNSVTAVLTLPLSLLLHGQRWFSPDDQKTLAAKGSDMASPHVLDRGLSLSEEGEPQRNGAKVLSPDSPQSDHFKVLPKSKVSLSPPWSRIFREENVTLTCQLENGTPLAGITAWKHNDRDMNETSPNLKITYAQELDSGDYKCEGENSQLSDPVHLNISSDYLLLQATAENLQEGQPLLLQCHSWKNQKVDKVTYYKNNVSLEYWYDNHNISMEKATIDDNGKYHCEGRVEMVERTSEAVFINVSKIPALLLLLMAMDSALFILTQQQLTQVLQSTKKGRKATGSNPNPQRDRAKT
ncbi:high affinity immunoglobulin epsilon receptor subunit alpha [Suncus etruscus]|uniref:high affinity immunoglobulin epsilon receptor subunit alpha n=1 Tax=Suncus etruscus TaxID=109475 RepID=UPI00210FD9F8|nr:high affinity immunoglobulin epsilon receptor subunit alpha [Suncus etruscus]